MDFNDIDNFLGVSDLVDFVEKYYFNLIFGYFNFCEIFGI